MKWSVVDRWGTHPLLIKAFVDTIVEQLEKIPQNIKSNLVILFTAHSLPMSIINRLAKIMYLPKHHLLVLSSIKAVYTLASK